MAQPCAPVGALARQVMTPGATQRAGRGRVSWPRSEIESTTSIYSGLLRMSDLLARQPNISVPLFLVAPDERRTVLGVEPDFEHLRQGKQDADGWMLPLPEVIINALGAEVWNAVHISLVRYGSHAVAVAHCPARTTETWHTDGGGELFYIRAANGTRELSGSTLLKYIRERWPS